MKHVLAIAFFGMIASAPAYGENSPVPCGRYDDAIKNLADKYNEHPITGGITGQGTGIAELLTTADGSTWTILVHGPDGTACLIAAGTDWGSIAPAPSGEPL